MAVTDITEQKNTKDRFSVSVDGEYAFSISADDLLESKLRVGDELSESEIELYKQKSADSLLLARTYDKCLRRPHSEREIRDYLRTKRAGEETTEFIIAKCYKLKLLDDEVFAQKWVDHRRRQAKSNRYIRSELFKKGIAGAIINEVLAEDDSDQLARLVEKKAGKYEDDAKLIAYLQRQGFGYSDVKAAVDVFKNPED